MGHEQAHEAPSRQQLDKIVEYESQVYVAQAGSHLRRSPGGSRRTSRTRAGRAARSSRRRPRRQRLRSGLRALHRVEGQRLLPLIRRPRRGYLHVPPVLAARCDAHQLHRLGQPAEAHLRHLPQRANDRPGSLGRMGRRRHHQFPHLDRTLDVGGIERASGLQDHL